MHGNGRRREENNIDSALKHRAGNENQGYSKGIAKVYVAFGNAIASDAAMRHKGDTCLRSDTPYETAQVLGFFGDTVFSPKQL